MKNKGFWGRYFPLPLPKTRAPKYSYFTIISLPLFHSLSNKPHATRNDKNALLTVYFTLIDGFIVYILYSLQNEKEFTKAHERENIPGDLGFRASAAEIVSQLG